VTYSEIKKDETINAYISGADRMLEAIGYNEHSFAHVTRVAETARYILRELGYGERECELVGIAAHLHDIGNIINRHDHAQSGALLAFSLLTERRMPADDIATVICAIGNHDEGTGSPVDPVSAALILADKSDVRRSRVRRTEASAADIHYRVNYSVESSSLDVDAETREVVLTISIDTQYSSVSEYFEIFLGRMILCRKAAERLGLRFRLNINGQVLM